MNILGFNKHDHGRCVSNGIDMLVQQCKNKNLRLTPLRQRVLEILLSEHRAMGAYEILVHLQQDGMGLQPPIAYRTLHFLNSLGLIHRIESLNAYIACSASHGTGPSAFLICRECKQVAELPIENNAKAVVDAASNSGFKVDNISVEIEGLCQNCY